MDHARVAEGLGMRARIAHVGKPARREEEGPEA